MEACLLSIRTLQGRGQACTAGSLDCFCERARTRVQIADAHDAIHVEMHLVLVPQSFRCPLGLRARNSSHLLLSIHG